MDGIRHGFKLDFCPAQKLKAAKNNKPSTHQHQSVIDDYLANEVSLERVAGPFNFPPFPNLQVSSFGVVPKKGQPGKWQLIVDLSSPRGLVLMMVSTQLSLPSLHNSWVAPIFFGLARCELLAVVMEHTSRAFGLLVPGLLLSNRSPLLTRSSSWL